MLAAEYVLGTLDPAEREDARGRIASDFSFAALVQNWERRLGELHALTGDTDPPGAVWDAIKAKLPAVAPSAAVRTKCVELGVSPTFHSVTKGVGTRVSRSNVGYNQIGHFGEADEISESVEWLCSERFAWHWRIAGLSGAFALVPRC